MHTVKSKFICYASEGHVSVGWGPSPVLGCLLDSPGVDNTLPGIHQWHSVHEWCSSPYVDSTTTDTFYYCLYTLLKDDRAIVSCKYCPIY